MSVVTRTKIGTAAAGGNLIIEYDEPTPPSSSFGHVLVFESHTTTAGVTPLPEETITALTGAGWHHVTSTGFESINGNNKVRTDHFTIRGNGTLNGVTVPGTTSVIRRGVLHTIDAITQNQFHHAVVGASSASNTLLQRSVTMPAATAGGVVTIVGVGISGSAGGASGFSWNRGSAGFAGTSSSSGFSSRFEVITPVAETQYLASWANTGSVSSMVGVQYGGAAGDPTVVHTDYDAVAIRDFRNSASTSGGVLSHSIVPTTGVQEPEEGLFIFTMTGDAQYFTVTSTDSIGGVEPVVTELTIPPLVTVTRGLERVIYKSGELV